MKVFSIFYDLGLHLFAFGSLPKVIWRWARKGKYRNFFYRLGVGFPRVEREGKPLVWVHAVSLGETKAVTPLIKELQKEFRVLLSTTTETGYAEGKKAAPDYHVYLPFDLSYLIRPIIKRVKPNCVILTETDFWYHFQDAAKAAGATLVLINGKISERSTKRFSRFPAFSKHLLHPIDLFCLQGELYSERFQKLGISPRKIVVTGNLKLEGLRPEKGLELKKELHIQPGDLVLTLGSTHDPEEKIWISHLKELWKIYPQLKVLMVPRHPERFDEVARLLEKEGIGFNRWSKKKDLSQNVLLVDTMGVLCSCYQISTVAFVGGSLTEKVGGHNILEPAFYGVPALYGPHMQGQPDLLDLMVSYKAGVEVSQANISLTLQKMLHSPSLREELSTNGMRMVQESKGALNATYQAIFPYLGCNK